MACFCHLFVNGALASPNESILSPACTKNNRWSTDPCSFCYFVFGTRAVQQVHSTVRKYLFFPHSDIFLCFLGSNGPYGSANVLEMLPVRVLESRLSGAGIRQRTSSIHIWALKSFQRAFITSMFTKVEGLQWRWTREKREDERKNRRRINKMKVCHFQTVCSFRIQPLAALASPCQLSG